MMFIELEWNCNMASFWNLENNREDNREINLQNTNSSDRRTAEFMAHFTTICFRRWKLLHRRLH